MERCLSAPGAKLGDAALNKLSQFFTSRLRRLTGLNYSDFFDAQRKMVHAQMDKAAAGDSRGLGPSDIPCFIDILCAFYSMNRNALGTEIDLYRDTLANILSGTEAKMPREERYSHSWGPFGSASRIAIGTYIHSLSGLDRRIKNSKAGLHSILAGLATLRYRIRHGGEWPKKLQECELDEHLSIDPWLATKAHLEFRVDDNETLVVWSVGENQKDDGGTLNDRSEKDLVLQILTDRNGGKNGKE